MAVKTALKKKAKINASVSKTKSGITKTIKNGKPIDRVSKNVSGGIPVVGLSLGVTKNMGDYESCRVDAWLSRPLEDGEEFYDAYSGTYDIVQEVVEEILDDIIK